MKSLTNTKALLKTTLLVLLMAGCSWSSINKQGLGMIEGPSTASDEEQWETFLRLMDDADELSEITGFLEQHPKFVNSKHWWTKDTDYTPLHYAADQGDLEVVKELIARGAEVNVKTASGMTPLHYAVAAAHLEVVKYLSTVIEKSCRQDFLNSQNNKGVSPLHIAVRGGCKNGERYGPIIEFLIKEAPDAIKIEVNDGNTALHLAAYLGSSRIVDILLSSPAIDIAVLKKNKGGKSPLDVAKKEDIKIKLEERLKIVRK